MFFLYSIHIIFVIFHSQQVEVILTADPISAPEVSYYINITFRKSPYSPYTPYWKYWELLRVGGLSKTKKEKK